MLKEVKESDEVKNPIVVSGTVDHVNTSINDKESSSLDSRNNTKRKKIETFDIAVKGEAPVDSDTLSLEEKMWTKDYIGLYSQFAAVGLLYGMSGVTLNFCVYHFEGEPNLCANANNFMFLAWNFKLFYAIGCDSYRPWGKRRVPYMIIGWIGVLVSLFILAVSADSLSASGWIGLLMLVQAFVMLSDVPADGYCVELGQLETKERRGQILATGQRIRFTFCVVAGVIQTFLTNGPDTNAENCKIAPDHCWKWGFTVPEYYGFMFCLVLILSIPVYFLKEITPPEEFPQHTVPEFLDKVWKIYQNLTTLYLLIYVIGTGCFVSMANNAAVYLQYYVLEMTNFQAGIDTITTYLALVAGIYFFQRYLINRDWRFTKYLSVIFSSLLGLLWPLAYHDSGGLRNPWFTIFVDLDQQFASGISQVLYSMGVIELASKGLEATTYELVVSVGNSALTVGSVLSTQLLASVGAQGCTEEDVNNCPNDSVHLDSEQSFEDSNGPRKFSDYTFLIIGIQIIGAILFVPFLPRSKEQCEEWKKKGEQMGLSEVRGKVGIGISVFIILYGITAAIMLLNDDTSCEKMVGGYGCR